MPKAVRTVQHTRRRCPQETQGGTPGEQVPHERFAAGDQVVAEHVPRASLEPAIAECPRQVSASLRAPLEVILKDDRLTIEEEGRAVGPVEQFVDQWHEGDAECFRRLVPFAVPMRVRDDERDLGRARHVSRVISGRPAEWLPPGGNCFRGAGAQLNVHH
jgi:hypothetical protein